LEQPALSEVNKTSAGSLFFVDIRGMYSWLSFVCQMVIWDIGVML